MGWDIIGADEPSCREGAQHRRQRKQRSAAKGVLRTAASLLSGHHGSKVPQQVEIHLGMSAGSSRDGNETKGAWGSQAQAAEWMCKWCCGPDGQKYRNHRDRKSCRLCNVSKSFAYHHQKSNEVRKPSTSMAERQVLAEKADNRKQLQAQKKRIEHLEKQLSAKLAGGLDEESGSAPAPEEVNPARLAARQQRAQKLLAEAQAEGLLGSLDISTMPWTKVVLPKAADTAESLHKEAKGKYSSAWGRWKRCTLSVDEQRVHCAGLEEQLEAARLLLLKHEEDFKLADSALSEAAKLVELAAAKQKQEMAEKCEAGGSADEEMLGPAPAKKKATAGAEEKALLASFQEELLADVRSGRGEAPSDAATQSFVAKCSSLFLNLQKVVAEQQLKEAAVAAGGPAAAPPGQPEGSGERARTRTRSPHRVPRSHSLPPKEGDSL